MVVTLQDIARLTNTSKSTVSRYLNGGSVSAEKARRISQAIKELNYQPNMNARRLVSSKSGTVAVVFDDISNYVYSDMIAGINTVAAQHELSCLYLSRSQGEEEDAYFYLLKSGMADGLIFVTFRSRTQQHVQALKDSKHPLVLVGDCLGLPGVLGVDVDNEQGTMLQIAHLIAKGHRDIAYLEGPSHMPAAAKRREGYLSALKQADLTPNPNLIKQINWSAEDGYKATAELLKNQQFTALAASNAYAAYGAMLAITDNGLSIPGDIALAGFDEAPILQLARPPVTTLAQPIKELGQIALTQLIKRIRNPDMSGQLIKVLPEMILRASTAD